MGNLLILISFLTLTLNGFSQGKQLKVDTFQKVNGFVSSYLLISSDTSFFIAFADCTEAEISKGKWKKEKNRITLIPETENEVKVKPLINYEENDNDSFITFIALDYFQRPFESYGFVFFDHEMKEHHISTNKEGVLHVPKNKFVAYLTPDEYDNMEIGRSLSDYIHTLDKGLAQVKVTLNYPIEVLMNRPRLKPFVYKGDTFIKTRKGLSSITNRLSLKKL